MCVCCACGMLSIESVKFGPTTENKRAYKQRKTNKNPITNSQAPVEPMPTEQEIAEFIAQALEKGVGLGEKSGKQPKVVQYYSKTRDKIAKTLSNFKILPKGLHVDGKVYPSVEAAFQCEKLGYLETKLEEAEKKKWEEKFEKNGEFDQENPKAKGYVDSSVKSKGGKGFYKKNNWKLDMVRWNRDSVKIMRKLLQLRFDQDPEFKAIINACKKADIKLKHFERPPRAGHFWGTSFDKVTSKWRDDGNQDGNWHGKLLMELYDRED